LIFPNGRGVTARPPAHHHVGATIPAVTSGAGRIEQDRRSARRAGAFRLRAETPMSTKGNGSMKTMTCRQLGGPCDVQHHGNTADEVIKAQDKHLNEIVAEGDEAHKDALGEMKGRWKHPIAGMGWYRQAKRDFAALAES
jgi:hypothetical protein